MPDESFQIRGTVLPERVSRAVCVVDGRVTYDAAGDLPVAASDVWLVPGLVDAHCHVGLGETGAVDEAEQEAQAVPGRDAGALALRDRGVPADTRWIDGRPDLPEILRAGRHIARPKRYSRDIGIEIEP